MSRYALCFKTRRHIMISVAAFCNFVYISLTMTSGLFYI